LLLSAPQRPLSVLTTMTARFRISRTSMSGWLKSPALAVTSASTSFISDA